VGAAIDFRCWPSRRMTSQGSADGRFTRAIQTRNLWAAETALRELRVVSLLDALDYLELLAIQRRDRFDRAAVRRHGRPRRSLGGWADQLKRLSSQADTRVRVPVATRDSPGARRQAAGRRCNRHSQTARPTQQAPAVGRSAHRDWRNVRRAQRGTGLRCASEVRPRDRYCYRGRGHRDNHNGSPRRADCMHGAAALCLDNPNSRNADRHRWMSARRHLLRAAAHSARARDRSGPDAGSVLTARGANLSDRLVSDRSGTDAGSVPTARGANLSDRLVRPCVHGPRAERLTPNTD